MRGAATAPRRHSPAPPPVPPPRTDKAAFVAGLLAAKAASGKTWRQVAGEVGLTTPYVAQLLLNQAQLKAESAPALRQALPALTDEQVAMMQLAPLRSFDPSLIQEPLVYRWGGRVVAATALLYIHCVWRTRAGSTRR